jgi:hypothetical protein
MTAQRMRRSLTRSLLFVTQTLANLQRRGQTSHVQATWTSFARRFSNDIEYFFESGIHVELLVTMEQGQTSLGRNQSISAVPKGFMTNTSFVMPVAGLPSIRTNSTRLR